MRLKTEPSNFSLQLLSMPDFLKSINTGGSKSESPTSHPSGADSYGPKTLIGYWQNQRESEELPRLPMISTYNTEFRPYDHEPAKENKLSATNMCDDLWALNQGMPFSDLMRQGPPGEFKNNFATLYDLTHGGVCPELYRTQKPAIVKKITEHKPENDYALEYGNLTDRGLRRFKLKEWAEEESVMERIHKVSLYSDDFTEQPLEKITKLRSAKKQCSSSFNKIILDNRDFIPRNIPFRFVSEDCTFPVMPRKLINIVPELD